MALIRSRFVCLSVALGLAAICMLASPFLAEACTPLTAPSDGLTIDVYLSDTMQHLWRATDDRGSGAHDNLEVFRPNGGYWFGHSAVKGYDQVPDKAYTVTYNGDITAPNSPIAKPNGWNRIWGLRRCSDRQAIFGMWCPVPPEGYVALGCIFRHTGCGGEEADQSPTGYSGTENLVTLRKDLTAPASSTSTVWADHGSGANDDGSIFTITSQSGGCGAGLGVMLAQAGYPDTGDVGGFAVPDKSKVYIRANL